MTDPPTDLSADLSPRKVSAPSRGVSDLAAYDSLNLRARYVMEGFLTGIHGSPFHGASVEFAEYRAYQPGDDPRHLDWRLFARCDRLYSKLFDHETNARSYLVVDTSGSMAYRGSDAWGSKLECAVVVAAALGSLLLHQNDAVGLVTLDEPTAAARDLALLRPSQKRAQRGRLLGRLESLRGEGGGQLGELLTLTTRVMKRRSIVIVLSDLLDPAEGDVTDALQRMRFDGHECHVVQILDRDELELPFADSSLFVDMESGERLAVDPAAVRASYLERFAAFQDRYARLFGELEMPHLLLRTDADPTPPLAEFLAARSRHS